MMKNKIIKKNKVFILLFVFIISGCSGTLFGYNELYKQYKEKKSNDDFEIYYTANANHIVAAVRNISNTFITGLNMSMECTYENGDIITDINSLSNLKTYYYKEAIFKVDYSKCISILLYYTYYPQTDGGFMYRDKFGAIPLPENNYIPVDGVLVIK